MRIPLNNEYGGYYCSEDSIKQSIDVTHYISTLCAESVRDHLKSFTFNQDDKSVWISTIYVIPTEYGPRHITHNEDLACCVDENDSDAFSPDRSITENLTIFMREKYYEAFGPSCFAHFEDVKWHFDKSFVW